MFEFLDDLFPAKPSKLWLIGPLVLALGIAGVFGYSCVKAHNAAVHTQKAEEHHEAASKAQGAAEAYDKRVEDRKPEDQSNAKEVARLKAELAKVKAEAEEAKPNEPAPLYPDLRPVVAKQDAVIQAQDRRIQGLIATNLDLTHSRDWWRNVAQEQAQELIQKDAVIKAQEGLIKGALWKGRIQGLAVGIGSGYVAGRLR